MPALRKRPDEIGDEAYVGCLAYGMATRGVRVKDLLPILGYNKDTYRTRKANPETVTVGELRKLYKHDLLTDDGLLKIITGKTVAT